MKRTLLDLTQTILSSLDGDEVNSIGDTTEAQQVAEVIRTAYFNIIARTTLPEHRKLFTLTASGDPAMPVVMYRPANLIHVEWVKYDTSTADFPNPNFSYVTILPQEQFLDYVQGLNVDDTDVDQLVLGDITFNYKTQQAPRFCTAVQDTMFLFDAYDNTVDGTLQETKTLCFGKLSPNFEVEDNFIPDLDDEQFPLLLNEAKALAFFELKQMNHPKADQEARRQWSSVQRNKALTDQPSAFDRLPDFGRRARVWGTRWTR